MLYMMKAGILYNGKSETNLAAIKNMVLGSQKSIVNAAGEMLLKTEVRYKEEKGKDLGDVRNREFILRDIEGNMIGIAYPEYAKEEDPDAMGWPIHRMPRVDHADVILHGAAYLLTMQNSHDFVLTKRENTAVVRFLHRGVAGGWMIEDYLGLTPETLCGLFIFCRYLERENELVTV